MSIVRADSELVSLAADNSTTEVHLSECGTLGRQTLLINASSHITMTFHAARSAIGQRGFIVRVEGTFSLGTDLVAGATPLASGLGL